MKGHRGRRDPESRFSAVVCCLQLPNPSAPLVCSLSGLLGKTRTGSAPVLPAVWHAGARDRRTVRPLSAWGPRVRFRTFAVFVYRSHARNSASFQILRPCFSGPAVRTAAPGTSEGRRFPRMHGSSSAAASRATARARIQSGGTTRAAAWPGSGSQPSSPAQEHAEPDGVKPVAARLESFGSIRGPAHAAGLRDCCGRCLHHRRHTA